MAWIGLLVPSPEVVNNAAFIVIFPLTFVANTFVPLEHPARAAADVRRVEPGLGGDPGRPRPVRQPQPQPDAPAPTRWSLQHPVAYTLIWAVAVLLVFVPLANRQYRRSASR